MLRLFWLLLFQCCHWHIAGAIFQPPLFDAAQRRPLSTLPAQAACAVPTPQQLVHCSDGRASRGSCFCNRTCPFGYATPMPSLQLLTGDSTYNSTTNSSVGSGPAFKKLLLQDWKGVEEFSLAFRFLLPDGFKNGTIFYQTDLNGSLIFAASLSTSGLHLTYKDASAIQHRELHNDSYQTGRWYHLGVQFYKNRWAVFLDGAGPQLTPLSVYSWQAPSTALASAATWIVLASACCGHSDFKGQIRDFVQFNQTISNRDMNQLYTGRFMDTGKDLSECRCPPSHPRMSLENDHICLTNLVNESSSVGRLNPDAYPLQFANDDDPASSWISARMSYVAVTVSLPARLQVDTVALELHADAGSALLPKRLRLWRSSHREEDDSSWLLWAEFSSEFKENETNCGQSVASSINYTVDCRAMPASQPGRLSVTYSLPNPFVSVEQRAAALARRVRIEALGHQGSTAGGGYYGLYELRVLARCDCSGQAKECLVDAFNRSVRCVCAPESYTQGDMCEQCLPLYNEKPYAVGQPCRQCNCNGHAEICIYNRTLDDYPTELARGGGGVCINCNAFTTGRWCELCQPGYYRPDGVTATDTQPCRACDCNPFGSLNQRSCSMFGGQCSCRPGFGGRRCDVCASGFYKNFTILSSTNDSCVACNCSDAGTDAAAANTCNPDTGACKCKRLVGSRDCSVCLPESYNLTADNSDGCVACDCHPAGTAGCNPLNGSCQCQPGHQGVRCDSCRLGSWAPTLDSVCRSCNCSAIGALGLDETRGDQCDQRTGACRCWPGVTGAACNRCANGFYNLSPTGCLPCRSDCHPLGSRGCDPVTGACLCVANVGGDRCDRCLNGTWNLTVHGCFNCSCDATGTLLADNSSRIPQCNPTNGACVCLPNRTGQTCNTCLSGYHRPPGSGVGCIACTCEPLGSLGPECDSVTGKCSCRLGFTGLRCDTCDAGFFSYPMCKRCGCNAAGSVATNSCNRTNGICQCKLNVIGDKCDQCKPGTGSMDASNPEGCTGAPALQGPPVMLNRGSNFISIGWEPPEQTNGVINGYDVMRNNSLLAFISVIEPRNYTDNGLAVFTAYSYSIVAKNSAGTAASRTRIFVTQPAAPMGTFTVNVSSIRPSSVSLSWSGPREPNGPLDNYTIKSTDTYSPAESTVHAVLPGTALSAEVHGLRVFSDYRIQLIACGPGGCLQSRTAVFTTLGLPPAGLGRLNITAVNFTDLLVSWPFPTRPNGIVQRFQLWLNDSSVGGSFGGPVFQSEGRYDPRLSPTPVSLPGVDNSGPAASALISGLRPFSAYALRLTVVGSFGASFSDWFVAQTGSTAPAADPSPPNLTPINSSSVRVTWTLPSRSILLGDLANISIFAGTSSLVTVFVTNRMDLTQFVASGYRPYQNVTFLLRVCNFIACRNSSSVETRLDAAPPEDQPPPWPPVPLPPPTNASLASLQLSWQPPRMINGPPPRYRLDRLPAAAGLAESPTVLGVRLAGSGCYRFPGDLFPYNVDYFGLELFLRTSGPPRGLLLWSAVPDGRQYLAVYLTPDGKLHFRFDLGDSDAVTRDGNCSTVSLGVSTDAGAVQQGRWHQVSIRRFGRHSQVTIDGKVFANDSPSTTGISEGCPRRTLMGLSAGVFIGGLPDIEDDDSDVAFSAAKVIASTEGRRPIVGCLRDVRILFDTLPSPITVEMDWRRALMPNYLAQHWQGCPVETANGLSARFLGRGFAATHPGALNLSCNTSNRFFRFELSFRTSLASLIASDSGIMLLAFAHGNGNLPSGQTLLLALEYVEDDSPLRLVALLPGMATITVAALSTETDANASATSLVCNKNWHRLELEMTGREAAPVVIHLDGTPLTILNGYAGANVSGSSQPVPAMCNLTSPMYLGGLPSSMSSLTAAKAVSTLRQILEVEEFLDLSFSGCLANISYQSSPVQPTMHVSLDSNIADSYNVQLDDSCPSSPAEAGSCDDEKFSFENGTVDEEQEKPVTLVYEGSRNSAIDAGLRPFSAYLYRVVSANEKGEAQSQWVPGHTGEGVPDDALGPSSVNPINDASSSVSSISQALRVSWPATFSRLGPVIGYRVRAYHSANESLLAELTVDPPSSMSENFMAVITCLAPYKRHRVRIAACTRAGCGDSGDYIDAKTLAAAPSGVSILSRSNSSAVGPTWIMVAWDHLPRADSANPEAAATALPGLNGPLVEYRLWLLLPPPDAQLLLYSGQQRQFNHTGLRVGTAYTYTLSVCNPLGCSQIRGEDAARLETAQLPPEGVGSPQVTVLGATTAQIAWAPPVKMNGRLEKYQLRLGNASACENLSLTEIWWLAYSNSSDDIRSVVMDNLEPDSEYCLALEVCSGGGCSTGQPVQFKTEESSPEYVPSPRAVFINATAFRIVWDLAKKPNGEILFHQVLINGQLVANQTERSLSVTDLPPWSLATIQVLQCTAAGCGGSASVSIRTLEVAPVGNVRLTALTPSDPRSAQLFWTNPTSPNGLINYTVLALGLFYVGGTGRNYSTVIETRPLLVTQSYGQWIRIVGLMPMSVYYFHVHAENSVGSLTSNTVTVAMPSGSPDGVEPPRLTVVNATALQASWGQVGRPNSMQPIIVVLQMRIQDGQWTSTSDTPASKDGSTVSSLVTGLMPNTPYEFRAAAQSLFGTGYSEPSLITMPEAAPGPVAAPKISEVTAVSVVTSWFPPNRTNGQLVAYQLLMDGKVIASLSPANRSYRAVGLLPWQRYTFAVLACTNAGCSLGSIAPVTEIRTLAAPSEEVPAPDAIPISSRSVRLQPRPPMRPNGPLIEFRIFRQNNSSTVGNTSGEILIGSIPVTIVEGDSAEYIGELIDSEGLRPWSIFRYRVQVVNSAGYTFGEWAVVRTLPAPPEQPAKPIVNIDTSSPRKITVFWKLDQTIPVNGPFERLELIVDKTRTILLVTSQDAAVTGGSTTVDNLQPWSNHTVSLRVCNTGGGCTDSEVVGFFTPAAPPDGPPAVPTTIPRRTVPISVDVSWKPTEWPNGHGLRYRLRRLSVPVDFWRSDLAIGSESAWNDSYVGSHPVYRDFNIEPFVVLIYSLSVQNDVGSTEYGEPSKPILAWSGGPLDAGPAVVAAPAGPQAALVKWTLPSVRELRGFASSCRIELTSPAAFGRVLEIPDCEAAAGTEVFIRGLFPGIEYFVTVNLTVIPAGWVMSNIAKVRTLDSVSDWIERPYPVIILNLTSARIYFKPPASISTYNLSVEWSYAVLVNGEKILLDSERNSSVGNVLSAIVTALLPNRANLVQIEACSSYYCVLSNATAVATSEVPPNGQSPPSVESVGSRWLKLLWSAPKEPGGVITSYGLYRRSVQHPCWNNVNLTASSKCQYARCPMGWLACNTSACYRPDEQVCCDGRIHTKVAGFQCCTGGGYESVPNGSVCCRDSEFPDALNIGLGNACCGGFPYYKETNGDQLCCGGRLYSSRNNQCCGDKVASSDLVCCGDSAAYQPQPNMSCCGDKYVPTRRNRGSTFCCQEGTDAVLYSLSEDEMISGLNFSCCGLQLVETGKSTGCCAGRTFDSTSEVCASSLWCGFGVTCPTRLAASAACDSCNFAPDNETCHAVRLPALENRAPTQPKVSEISVYNAMIEATESHSKCLSEPRLVYDGPQSWFNDSGLSPSTSYAYSVEAASAAGVSNLSLETTSRTLADAPEFVTPPVVEPVRPDALNLVWSSPTQSNGPIRAYRVERRQTISNKTLEPIALFNGLALNFIDSLALQPFQLYEYRLIACTDGGCTASNWVEAATAEALPEGIDPPSLSALAVDVVLAQWQPPRHPNGRITQYRLYDVTNQRLVYSGLSKSFRYSGLYQDTLYAFLISACTRQGCVNSTSWLATVRTLRAAPANISAPGVLLTGNDSVVVYWSEPAGGGRPVGYAIEQRVDGDLEFRVVSTASNLPSWQRNASISGLISNRRYWYRVLAIGVNNASRIVSPSVLIQTPKRQPSLASGIIAIEPLSNVGLRITWTLLPLDLGIDQYILTLISEFGELLQKRFVFRETIGTVSSSDGLRPNCEYSVAMLVCQNITEYSCRMGNWVLTRTVDGAPFEIPAPLVFAADSYAMQLQWDVPQSTRNQQEIQTIEIERRKLPRSAAHEVDSPFVRIGQVDGNRREFRDFSPELNPNSAFQYRLLAVNIYGKTASNLTTVVTADDIPQRIPTPNVSILDAFSLRASWNEDAQQSGQVLLYRLDYKAISSSTIAVDNAPHSIELDGSRRSCVIGGLQPSTVYRLRLSAFNSRGVGAGDWVDARTGEAPPAGLEEMTSLAGVDGRELLLNWPPPRRPNGLIRLYRVKQVLTNGDTAVVYTGLSPGFRWRPLEPFTEYRVALEACTGAGCVTGATQSLRTAETRPIGQPPPQAAAFIVIRNANDTAGRSNRNKTYLVDNSSSDTKNLAQPTNLVSRISVIVRLNWTAPDRPNGKIREFRVLRRFKSSEDGSMGAPSAITVSIVNVSTIKREITTYSATDTTAKAWTEYKYSIEACNSVACIESETVDLKTPESTPGQPEIPTVVPLLPMNLIVSWRPPTEPNGRIVKYGLYRNGSKVYGAESVAANSTMLSWTDNSPDLLPYTWYAYSVVACNSAANPAPSCGPKSVPGIGRTPEAPPEGVSAPMVVSVTANAVHLSWIPPGTNNGVIIRYILTQNEVPLFTSLPADSRTAAAVNLTPFTQYAFRLAACTAAGCTYSSMTTVRTSEAAPADMEQPVLTALDASRIAIAWRPPRRPNGVLISYKLLRNSQQFAEVSSATLEVIDTGLLPATAYSYSVIATNSAGGVRSADSIAVTTAGAPEGFQAPRLSELNATAVKIVWIPPERSNGLLRNYTLTVPSVVNIPLPPTTLLFALSALRPFTNYSARLTACTDAACATTEALSFRTLEATPSGQSPPTLRAVESVANYTDIGVAINWSSPAEPNGRIIRCQLERQAQVNTDGGFADSVVVLNSGGSKDDGNWEYIDKSKELLPYTFYRYRVGCFNSLPDGSLSDWALVRTPETPPEGVFAPLLLGVTNVSVTLQIQSPVADQLNGQLKNRSLLLSKSRVQLDRDLLVISLRNLTPNTAYVAGVEACNSAGCSTGPTMEFVTLVGLPQGLQPPAVLVTSVHFLTLAPVPPTKPNGPIDGYELIVEKTEQEKMQTAYPMIRDNSVWNLTNLMPYEKLRVRLVVSNARFRSDEVVWLTVRTKPMDPIYMRQPLAEFSGSQVRIIWTNSFRLNGPLLSYSLYLDGRSVTGLTDTEFVFHEAPPGPAFYTVRIEASTPVGRASSPLLYLNPVSREFESSSPASAQLAIVTPASKSLLEQQPWLLPAILVVAALIAAALAAGLCILASRQSSADGRGSSCLSVRVFLRERPPLQRRRRSDIFEQPMALPRPPAYRANASPAEQLDDAGSNCTLSSSSLYEHVPPNPNRVWPPRPPPPPPPPPPPLRDAMQLLSDSKV